jgi:hypothetical protein
VPVGNVEVSLSGHSFPFVVYAVVDLALACGIWWASAQQDYSRRIVGRVCASVVVLVGVLSALAALGL